MKFNLTISINIRNLSFSLENILLYDYINKERILENDIWYGTEILSKNIYKVSAINIDPI